MATERETAVPPRIQMIARAQIAPDPEQPRTDADDELRGSIAHEGILEPIIVRAYPTETPAEQREAKKTPWMIVNGERRWRGSAGVLEELPCIVRRDDRVLDAARRKITQLAANEHKAMSPLDEGRAYHEVMLQTGMSIEEREHYVCDQCGLRFVLDFAPLIMCAMHGDDDCCTSGTVDCDVPGGRRPSEAKDKRQRDLFAAEVEVHDGRGLRHNPRCPDRQRIIDDIRARNSDDVPARKRA